MGRVRLYLDLEKDQENPCKGLVAGIVIRAILDVNGKGQHLVDDRAEATTWMYSKSQQPWAFEWCCSVLGLDPFKIRCRHNEHDVVKQIYNAVRGHYGHSRKFVRRNRKDRATVGVLGPVAPIDPQGFTWIPEGDELQPTCEL